MGNIYKSDRTRLDAVLSQLEAGSPDELCYAITKATMNYLEAYGQDLDMSIVIGAIGAVEEAADELRRRIKDPLEKARARSNGDSFQQFVKDHKLQTLF